MTTLTWQDLGGCWETAPAKVQPWDGDEGPEKQEASPQVTRGTGREGEEHLATRIQVLQSRLWPFRKEDTTCAQCSVGRALPSLPGKQGWLSPNTKGHRRAAQLHVNAYLAQESVRTG